MWTSKKRDKLDTPERVAFHFGFRIASMMAGEESFFVPTETILIFCMRKRVSKKQDKKVIFNAIFDNDELSFISLFFTDTNIFQDCKGSFFLLRTVVWQCYKLMWFFTLCTESVNSDILRGLFWPIQAEIGEFELSVSVKGWSGLCV